MAFAAFGLHPLDQIVNVHWVGVTVGLIDQFMQTNPQWLLSFAFKVPTEQNTSGDETRKLAVPKFGNNQNIPTPTVSNDQTITVDAFHIHIISGGSVLYGTPGLLLFSSKGFIIYQNYKIVQNPVRGELGQITYSFVPDGTYTCFDSKGKKTTVDKLPKEDSKGASIITAVEPNTPGTWYMSVDKGLRKFDSDGNMINEITPIPDTVVYDNTNNQLRLVWLSGPDADTSAGEIAWYDLNGTQVRNKLIGQEFADRTFNAFDCSKLGRIYALVAVGGATTSEGLINAVFKIEGYDYDGTHLFSIDPIGGFNDQSNQAEFFRTITCYGEDYIVATTFKKTEGAINMGIINGSLVTDLFVTNQQRRIIYDAKTGAQVDMHDYGEMRGDNTLIVRQTEPVHISENIQTISAYNIDNGIRHNDYFPRVEFKLPAPPT